MRFILTAALAWTGISVALPSRSNIYAGTKVFRIPTGNQNQTESISNVIDALGLPSWTKARMAFSHIDVQVSKDRLDSFHKALKAVDSNLDEQVVTMHDDLGASILRESAGMNTPYVDPLGSGTKPAVIFHGTVHAREWIATMVTENIAFSLLSNYTTSATIKSYVDKYDFYIFPVVNPDGFVYTQSSDRLWRKNRQPTTSASCAGRDINRNWPWKWDTAGGSSTSPCDETYRGASAGDAPENKGLSAFLNARSSSAAGAKLYIDFHAYGLLFMGPYGYSCTAKAADQTEHNKLEQGFAAAFKAPYGK
ncbi:hypothetical protein FRC07_010824, partial [Ceratobasidium sp. 392]